MYTKILYFAGGIEGQNAAGPLRPLILDHRIADGLARLAPSEKQSAKLPHAYPWSTLQYRGYLEVLDRWAKELGTAPDVIEWLLWMGEKRHSMARVKIENSSEARQASSERKPWTDWTLGAAGSEVKVGERAWHEWNLSDVRQQEVSGRVQTKDSRTTPTRIGPS